MTLAKTARVLFCPAIPEATADSFGSHFLRMVREATAALAQTVKGDGDEPWLVRAPLAGPELPNPVLPAWMDSAWQGIEAAGCGPETYFENSSLAEGPLATTEGLTARAAELGLTPFRVGDESPGGPAQDLSLAEDRFLTPLRLAPLAQSAPGLLLINGVRPHPHLGLGGALITLGSQLLDRPSRIRLHEDVKPSVESSLCASCGSCLGACLKDAISIRSGRAWIDHQQCLGCGECMTACHLGGIRPQEATAVERFQEILAESARAVVSRSQAGIRGEILYVNFLTPLPKKEFGGFGKDRFLKTSFGALLGTDPVALDQATWDLLVKGAVHGLRQWSGFEPDPGPLLTRAEALGLGCRAYRLEALA